MSQTYRLRLSRPALKLKVASRIPATLAATSPIVLTRSGADYTFSLDQDALEASLDLVYAPILIYDLLDEPVVVTGDDTVAAGTVAVAVQRAAPTATALALPSVLSRSGMPLRIFDWSTSVTEHTITLTPNGIETIMLAATWPIYSNTVQLGSLTLYPSTTLNGWYIAP